MSSGTIEMNVNGPAAEWFERMQEQGRDIMIRFGDEVEGESSLA